MTNLRFRINARYRNFRKKTMTSSGSVIDWADVFRLSYIASTMNWIHFIRTPIYSIVVAYMF